MSDEAPKRDSQKSRQELLDEIYYLRDVAGEREQQAQHWEARAAELRSELSLILHSRSWRITAPLRALTGWLEGGRDNPQSATMPPGTSAPDSAGTGTPAGRPRESPVQRPHSLHPTPDAACDRDDPRPRLFVDVTELELRHGRTGVQRVTREILHALLASPPPGHVVQPVVAETGQPYRLLSARHSREGGTAFAGLQTRTPQAARRASARDGASNPVSEDFSNSKMLDGRFSEDDRGPSRATVDPPIDPCPDDVFLGLDHSMRAVVEHADEFVALRAKGVRIWFVCNDVLPLDHPEWFPPDVHDAFKAWFQTIARVGDGIACISKATEAGVRRRLDALQIQRGQPVALGHFPLGCDLRTSAPVSVIADDEQALIDRLQGIPSFLMVGTLEPRKGHAQALAAFEHLWASGDEVALVIAGLPGWMTEVTQRRIRHHDEFGKRLFWFRDASDALLENLYENCSALLAPSEGEGFGLPLVEAARHGLPILCRDIPVFREVAGAHASYFDGRDPGSLTRAIHEWMNAWRKSEVPDSRGVHCLDWVESARELMDVIARG